MGTLRREVREEPYREIETADLLEFTVSTWGVMQGSVTTDSGASGLEERMSLCPLPSPKIP